MLIYAVAKPSAIEGLRDDSDHGAQGRRKRRTYRKRSVPARGSLIKMRIDILRNLPGRPNRFTAVARQSQKQSRRLTLFGHLRRSFQLRDQLVADRNVKDFVGMLGEATNQAWQQAPRFGDAQMSRQGDASFCTKCTRCPAEIQGPDCTNSSGNCTVVSVQWVVNAALGGTCVAP
jgi:hypothetical protein